MQERKRALWFPGAVMAGALLGAAVPSLAQEKVGAIGGPVLAGIAGGPYCGPCEPQPLVTRAAPDSTAVALRYRWSAEARRFELISEETVGVTDERGELRFTVPQGEGSLDKVEVWVGGARSDGFVFLTTAACPGPRLCPLPRRFHAFANASAYVAGQPVVITVSRTEPGRTLDVTLEEYVGEGDAWLTTLEPFAVSVDELGHATTIVKTPGPGVYRAIARDRETGEESGFSLFEVSERYPITIKTFEPVLWPRSAFY